MPWQWSTPGRLPPEVEVPDVLQRDAIDDLLALQAVVECPGEPILLSIPVEATHQIGQLSVIKFELQQLGAFCCCSSANGLSGQLADAHQTALRPGSATNRRVWHGASRAISASR